MRLRVESEKKRLPGTRCAVSRIDPAAAAPKRRRRLKVRIGSRGGEAPTPRTYTGTTVRDVAGNDAA